MDAILLCLAMSTEFAALILPFLLSISTKIRVNKLWSYMHYCKMYTSLELLLSRNKSMEKKIIIFEYQKLF